MGIGWNLSGCSDPIAVLVELLTRHGAIVFKDRCQRGNMIVLGSSHSQVHAFVHAKSEPHLADKLYGANLSVAFETDAEFEISLQEAESTRCGVLWAMAESSWRTGCPGLMLLERFRQSECELGLDLHAEVPIAPVCTTVPCGELGLRADETCNLGVVNLASPYHYSHGSVRIDELLLSRTIRDAVRCLDTVVDQLVIDDPAMASRAVELRRIGLGVAGFAEALELAGLEYDSADAREYAKWIGAIMKRESLGATLSLATERGPYTAGTVCKEFIDITSKVYSNNSLNCKNRTVEMSVSHAHNQRALSHDFWGIEDIR